MRLERAFVMGGFGMEYDGRGGIICLVRTTKLFRLYETAPLTREIDAFAWADPVC